MLAAGVCCSGMLDGIAGAKWLAAFSIFDLFPPSPARAQSLLLLDGLAGANLPFE